VTEKRAWLVPASISPVPSTPPFSDFLNPGMEIPVTDIGVSSQADRRALGIAGRAQSVVIGIRVQTT
jgi:hypothetical protein